MYGCRACGETFYRHRPYGERDKLAVCSCGGFDTNRVLVPLAPRPAGVPRFADDGLYTAAFVNCTFSGPPGGQATGIRIRDGHRIILQDSRLLSLQVGIDAEDSTIVDKGGNIIE